MDGKISTKTITRAALFGAVLFVSQVSLSSIGNCELVSILVYYLSMFFFKETLLAILIFNILELFSYGFGMWWISYLYIWFVPVVLAKIFGIRSRKAILLDSLLVGLFGLLFGILCTLPYVFIDISFALTYWLAGLSWDLRHAVFNFILCFLLGKHFKSLFHYIYYNTDCI